MYCLSLLGFRSWVCHDLTMFCLNISNFTIPTVKGVDNCFIRVHSYYFYYLIKTKILETKNILIDKKNYKDFVIYFTISDHDEKALIYINNNLIYSDNTVYLTVDSLIDISNIITGSNNITLRKVNVKPCAYDEIIWMKI